MNALIRWVGRAWEPSEISLGRYLASSIVVRLPAVLFSRGYDSLDHQYQYIDPAYHLGLGGSWNVYHDYVQGLRSWVYLHRRLFVCAHLTALGLVSFWYPMRGPIEAAVFLGGQEYFRDRLVVVDGSNEDAGGHFYLQRRKLDVIGVKRENLSEWLVLEFEGRPLYLMAVRQPLTFQQVPDGCILEELGAFSNRPDLQRHARRFLYRVSEVKVLRKGGMDGVRDTL